MIVEEFGKGSTLVQASALGKCRSWCSATSFVNKRAFQAKWFLRKNLLLAGLALASTAYCCGVFVRFMVYGGWEAATAGQWFRWLLFSMACNSGLIMVSMSTDRRWRWPTLFALLVSIVTVPVTVAFPYHALGVVSLCHILWAIYDLFRRG